MPNLAGILEQPVLNLAAELVTVILILASGFVVALSHTNHTNLATELAARIKSWWFMAIFFFIAILVNPKITIVFFALMSFWALKEYITIIDTRRADHRALVWAFLSIPIQYYWVISHWYFMFLIFIPVYMFLFIPLRLVLIEETEGFLAATAKIQWGIWAFIFSISHLAYLSIMPHIPHSKANGQSLLLFLVIVTQMNDVLQYIWGKSIGRHKILPKVSPNKTTEGFWGGTLTTALFSLILRFLTPFSIWECLFISYCIAVAGFCGDVVMAAVKRDAGVKDYGQTIPGHGGVLDRLNSLCYTAPIFFHLTAFFYY